MLLSQDYCSALSKNKEAKKILGSLIEKYNLKEAFLFE